MVFVFFLLFAINRIILCVDDEEEIFVTCGSVIKLKNVKNGRRLHSHDLKYGTGSGQQSVTAFPDPGDSNSYWLILGGFGEEICEPGTVIEHGNIIRFQHVETGKYLHSHLHSSPLSRNQEVSCYGESDTGDNWKVFVSGKSKWMTTKKIKLQHIDTKKYLYCNDKHRFRDPIPNQAEVACHKSSSDKHVYWQAEEGLFREEDI